jgi:Asp/Glu/hydantoin racemase
VVLAAPSRPQRHKKGTLERLIPPGSALHRTLLQDLPALEKDDAQLQVLAAALRLLARHLGIDTLVLECTNLPPCSAALRAATGLPVLDIVTLLNQRVAALPP